MNFDQLRAKMVEEQLNARGLKDPRLTEAFSTVPRHLFVGEEYRGEAYADHPLPIGHGQTISQPYIVALMTDALRLQGHERVLEVGAGSGYQTAILSLLALEVYAVERLPELLPVLRRSLENFGYLNVRLASRDGSTGWSEFAPFDAIVVAASCPQIPEPLVDQLAPRGRMVIPLGTSETQTLTLIEKSAGSVQRTEIAPCVFVPLVGKYGWPESPSR